MRHQVQSLSNFQLPPLEAYKMRLRHRRDCLTAQLLLLLPDSRRAKGQGYDVAASVHPTQKYEVLWMTLQLLRREI